MTARGQATGRTATVVVLTGAAVGLTALLATARTRGPKPAMALVGRARAQDGWADVAVSEPEPTGPKWALALQPEAARPAGDKLVQTLPDGARVTYTLDPVLQRRAEALLRSYAVPYGAVVLMDVHTGRLLVFAGAGTADPHLDARTLCLKAWAPAASVFKIVTTSALLSENKARPYTRVCYHGGRRRLTKRHIRGETKKDECETLAGALAKSTNAVIARLAYRFLDRKTLLGYAHDFGFGRRIPFVLPTDPSMIDLPEDPVEAAKVAAGFWHTTLSPLHGALLAGAIANRGLMVAPRLVDKVEPEEGHGLPEPWKHRVVSEYVAKLVGRMMVMTTTIGTAKRAFYTRRGTPYVRFGQVAGKTGSLTRPEPFVDYSWFVGFAPAERPEVAFAVLLGNPRKWRIKAATMARLLLQAYGRRRAALGLGGKPAHGRSR